MNLFLKPVLQVRPKNHNSKKTIKKPVLFHKRQLLKEYAGICLSYIVFLGGAACRLHIRLQSNAGHQKTALTGLPTPSPSWKVIFILKIYLGNRMTGTRRRATLYLKYQYEIFFYKDQNLRLSCISCILLRKCGLTSRGPSGLAGRPRTTSSTHSSS
jgi:hypothetical protein